MEIQIITGFDHICGIKNTEKYKYLSLRNIYETYIFIELLTECGFYTAASYVPVDAHKLGVNLI